MKNSKLVLGCMLVLIGACTHEQILLSEEVLNPCQQLVVTTSPDEVTTTGQLSYYERNGDEWVQVGSSFGVSFGRTGLAWGSGLHLSQPGYQKREGDGKSPSGVFRFSQAFGYAPEAEAPFQLPYVQATEWLECVDDTSSSQYNLLVDNRRTEKDWGSSEFMRLPDHQYKWGIFVEHNTPAQPGRGSCIFFHIWKTPGAPTSGCTAMAEEDLLGLMRWLDPAKQPLLVQLTEKDYHAFYNKLGLPGLPEN